MNQSPRYIESYVNVSVHTDNEVDSEFTVHSSERKMMLEAVVLTLMVCWSILKRSKSKHTDWHLLNSTRTSRGLHGLDGIAQRPRYPDVSPSKIAWTSSASFRFLRPFALGDVPRSKPLSLIVRAEIIGFGYISAVANAG